MVGEWVVRTALATTSSPSVSRTSGTPRCRAYVSPRIQLSVKARSLAEKLSADVMTWTAPRRSAITGWKWPSISIAWEKGTVGAVAAEQNNERDLMWLQPCQHLTEREA